jgi:hypothetical protein
MNNRYALLRAIQGPVVLITLGILFALDQAGTVRFGQAWPVLIIVIGLMKLAQHAAAPATPLVPQGPPPPPPTNLGRPVQ